MSKFQISIDSKQRIDPIATQCSVRELRPLTANGKHSYYAVTAAIRGRDLRRRTPVLSTFMRVDCLVSMAVWRLRG